MYLDVTNIFTQIQKTHKTIVGKKNMMSHPLHDLIGSKIAM